jgi:hypothetical protein
VFWRPPFGRRTSGLQFTRAVTLDTGKRRTLRFPVYVMRRGGTFWIVKRGSNLIAIGFLSKELAELFYIQCREKGLNSIDAAKVGSIENLRRLAATFAAKGVTHFSWDHLEHSQDGESQLQPVIELLLEIPEE